jgi:hypothetical protein
VGLAHGEKWGASQSAEHLKDVSDADESFSSVEDT